MASPLKKFPWRVDDGNALMEPVKGDNDKKRRNVFLQSATHSLVDALFEKRRFICVCGEPFSGVDEENYPGVAPCGHYKHQRCRHKFNQGENNCPCILNCKMLVNDEYGGTRDIVLPIAATLKEFYSDMIDPGYECMKCNDHHPLSNSIRVLKDEHNIDKPVGTYACVWCATKKVHGTPLISENSTVQFIDVGNDPVSPRDAGIRLKSLDRKSKIIPCITQCCACGESLKRPDPADSKLKKVELLPCEHYRHTAPLPAACSEVVCNMCGVQAPTDHQKRFVRIEDYLLVQLDKSEPCEVGICPLCDELHPKENMVHATLAGTTCRWCAVETKFYSLRHHKPKN